MAPPGVARAALHGLPGRTVPCPYLTAPALKCPPAVGWWAGGGFEAPRWPCGTNADYPPFIGSMSNKRNKGHNRDREEECRSRVIFRRNFAWQSSGSAILLL